jgi:O-antigen/teichoic acid export membrane protein
VVQTTLLLVVTGVIGTAIIYFGAMPIARAMNNPGMAPLMTLGAVQIGLAIASEQSIAFLIAQDRYKLAVAFEVGEAVLRVVLLLVPLWLGYGLTGLVVAGIVIAVVRFLARNVFLFMRSGLHYSNWTKSTFVGEQLAYSAPIAMIALVGLLGNTFNRGIVAASVTPAAYAVFAVGNVVLPFATIFQSSVANVLRAEMPPLVRDGKLVEIVRIVRESVRKLSIIVLPSFVFLQAHAYRFITVLFTHTYEGSVNVFRICVCELPLDMFILSAIPQVFGKTRVNMYINFAATAVLLVGSYTLIKAFGFYGAALAGIITQYFTVFLFFMVVLRLTQATLSQLLPFPGIFKVLAASLAAALGSWLPGAMTSVGVVDLFLAAVIFTLVFFSIAIPIGVFTREDWRLALRWIAKLFPGVMRLANHTSSGEQ